MSNPFAHTIAAITAEHLAKEQAKRRVYDEALAAFAQFDEVITPAKIEYSFSAAGLAGSLWLDELCDFRICFVEWHPDTKQWWVQLPGCDAVPCGTMVDCLQMVAGSGAGFSESLARAQRYAREKRERSNAEDVKRERLRMHVLRCALAALLVVVGVLGVVYGAEIPL